MDYPAYWSDDECAREDEWRAEERREDALEREDRFRHVKAADPFPTENDPPVARFLRRHFP